MSKVKKGNYVAFSDGEEAPFFEVLKVSGDDLTVRQVKTGETEYPEQSAHANIVRQVRDNAKG